MKKFLSLILVLVFVCSLCACGVDPAKEKMGRIKNLVESGEYRTAYDELMKSAELRFSDEGPVYESYCKAMIAYNSGAVGLAYEYFSEVKFDFDSKDYIAKLEKIWSELDGIYVSYKYTAAYVMSFKDGKVALKIDPEAVQGDYLNVNDNEYTYYVLTKEDSNDNVLCYIGSADRFNFTSEYNYSVVASGNNQLAVQKVPGSDFDAFEGVYTKK